MDVSEYVEALEALNECCDNPLMVEFGRDLADRVADDKARQLLLMIADEYERLTRP